MEGAGGQFPETYNAPKTYQIPEGEKCGENKMNYSSWSVTLCCLISVRAYLTSRFQGKGVLLHSDGIFR